MITGVNHIGIAVDKIDDIKAIFADFFEGNPIHEETVEEQKSKIYSIQVGHTHLEFLEPTSEDSPIASFLQKKGKGVHHISLDTDDITSEIARLKAKGFRMINEVPKNGMNNTKIAFVHPKSTSPLLIELTQTGE